MRAPHAGQRITAALAGVLLAGAALASPALAAGPHDDTAGASKDSTSAKTTTGDAMSPQAAAKAEPKGKVVSRLPLSIRQKPTTASGYLGGVPSGAVIALSCKVNGQNVDGNKLWYLLGNGRPGYVAARYVKNLSPVPWCEK